MLELEQHAAVRAFCANCDANVEPCGPVLKPADGAGVVEIGAGYETTCTRRNDGAVYCWGRGLRDAQQIALSDRDGCAIVGPQEVRCFGNDDWGQLGDPFDKKEVPYAVARW